jgi:hypothetical protein
MTTTMTTDRCEIEKNKKIFTTQAEAENFEERNREAYGHTQQYAYKCPQFDHFHLSSNPIYVPGAPQLKTTDWPQVKSEWRPVHPEIPLSDRILTALRRHNGTKTAREIGVECGLHDNQIPMIYSVAKQHNLPYKNIHSRDDRVTPVVTLQTVLTRRQQIEAELKQLEELEQDILRKEEEKKRVTVKLASNGNRNDETMIFATTFGCGGLWLTVDQANSLIAQLPGVIEEMKSREMVTS